MITSSPCCAVHESIIHIVGDGELHKEERNVLEEEMRKIDGCDMEKYDTLECREKRSQS